MWGSNLRVSQKLLNESSFLSEPNLGVFLSANTSPNTGTAATSTHATPSLEHTSERGAETKSAFKTTEFVIYLVAVAGVLIASNMVEDTTGRGDPFLADKAWLYITLLTVGYLISRGLAKSGRRDH